MPKIVFTLADGGQQIVEGNAGESVMQAATRDAVPGVIGECGGEMSCATCHVYVDDESSFSRISADEDDLLELADNRQANSRLSCQLRITADTPTLTVGVPGS